MAWPRRLTAVPEASPGSLLTELYSTESGSFPPLEIVIVTNQRAIFVQFVPGREMTSSGYIHDARSSSPSTNNKVLASEKKA